MKLHLTLCMFVLADDRERQQAVDKLKQCSDAVIKLVRVKGEGKGNCCGVCVCVFERERERQHDITNKSESH